MNDGDVKGGKSVSELFFVFLESEESKEEEIDFRVTSTTARLPLLGLTEGGPRTGSPDRNPP